MMKIDQEREEEAIIPLTREEAKRLADLHLALAQEYRKLIGLPPILTSSCQRKMMLEKNK